MSESPVPLRPVTDQHTLKTAAATRRYQHRDATVAAYHRSVGNVINHLRDTLEDTHTLETMAEIAALSPFHFNRIFREITGVPPVHFLYAMRIAEAKRLILTTELRIIDICYCVGYTSLGSFNKRFALLVGCSPRSIRYIAAHADIDGLRRLIVAQREAGLPGYPRSVHGKIGLPKDFSGVVLTGLFPGPPSYHYPSATAIAGHHAYALPPVDSEGDYFLMAAGLVWHDTASAFLLQDECLRAMAPPIAITPAGRPAPIDLILRPWQPLDPPLPPSLPVLLATKFIEVPEQVASEDYLPSHVSLAGTEEFHEPRLIAGSSGGE